MLTTFFAFARTRVGMSVLGLLALVIVAFALIAYGAAKERKREAARDAIAVAEAVSRDTKADQKSTTQVQREAVAIVEIQKELEDAVAQAPDSLPDAASVAYGCRELQRNGIRTSDLPACRAVGG